MVACCSSPFVCQIAKVNWTRSRGEIVVRPAYMLGSMRNVLLDADGAGGRVEAFAVCDATWGELARAAGQQVFEWGAAAWVDARGCGRFLASSCGCASRVASIC